VLPIPDTRREQSGGRGGGGSTNLTRATPCLCQVNIIYFIVHRYSFTKLYCTSLPCPSRPKSLTVRDTTLILSVRKHRVYNARCEAYNNSRRPAAQIIY